MIQFTFIIPHHNIPDLLSRCLRSIPEDDSVQVIVVDDNSKEQELIPELVPELQRSNVEYYPTCEGRGAGYVRNVGLSHAKGEWLLFADADDFYCDNLMEVIAKHGQTDADIVYFNTRSCLCEDTAVPADRSKDFVFREWSETHNEQLFRFGYTEPWGKMIRRSLVVENCITFDETMVSNDYLFSVMTGLYARKIEVVNHPLYVYTVRSGSLASDSGQIDLSKVRQRLLAYAHVQQFMQSHGHHTSPALTSHILIGLYKNYRDEYRKGVQLLRDNNISVTRLYYDTFMHYVRKALKLEEKLGDVYHLVWEK